MTVPDSVFWTFFVIVAAIITAGFLWFFLRGERVGTMRLPGRLGVSVAVLRVPPRATRVRLTIAREGGGRLPTVQLRVSVPMAMFMERIDAATATDLAHLLDTASARLREP